MTGSFFNYDLLIDKDESEKVTFGESLSNFYKTISKNALLLQHCGLDADLLCLHVDGFLLEEETFCQLGHGYVLSQVQFLCDYSSYKEKQPSAVISTMISCNS